MLHKLLATLQKQKNSLIWIAAVATGALTPAAYYLASGHTLVWRDSSKLFQPIRPLVVEALRSFHLPLWNPHEVLGIPLFAQMMHGVLHPVSVLGAFLFPHAGMDVFILIHIMLAAVGAFMLARSLGASCGAAAVAGFGYGLSGYVLGMSSNMQYLGAAATAPWTLSCLLMAGSGRRYGIAATAAATAVLHFAGDPQWTIIAIILGAALAAEAGGMRGFKNAGLGIAVGTALAGIQLIPTMVYLRETSRGLTLDIYDRFQWALAPWRVIELIVPGFFGSPNAGLTKWPVFTWLGGLARPGLEMPFVPSVYVGAGILVLAAAGVMHSRVTRIFGISSLVLLWLALGASAGAEQLTHFVPVWGKFRYAEKMVGPLTLCLSILAALGTDRLSTRPSRFWAALAGGAGLMSIVCALILMNWTGFDATFTDSVARVAAPHARHNLARGLVHAGSVMLALASLLFTIRRWPQLPAKFPALAAGLILLQSSLAAPFALHAGASNICDEFPLLQIKSSSERARIATPFEEGYHYPKGLDEFDAQTGGQSHMGVPSYNVPSCIDQVNTYTGLRPRRFDLLVKTLSNQFGAQSVLALRRYALTHMIIRNPYTANETELAIAASEGGVKVLENPEWDFTGWQVPHRPWATFAGKVITAPGEQEALDALVTTLSRGESTVILEGAPPGGLEVGQVLGIERKSNSLQVEAVSNGNGILVVNDSYWPGWRAKIDGKDVPLLRADFLVRAVPWPPGRHLLEMKYEPMEVKIGMLVSITGVVALIALFLTEWRRRGRKPSK